MARLEEVDLHKNKIERFPDFVFADIQRSPLVVEHLSVVNLKKNKLTDLPDCLFLLVNLEILNVSHNDIVKIPDKITVFYRLGEMRVDNNQLFRLPWVINKLHALRVLSCEHNLIHFLPNTVAQMKALESFGYQPNPLDESYAGAESIEELFEILRKQKVPKVYYDDALLALEQDKEKEEKLSEGGRLLRSLLKYTEGVDALEVHTKKEHNSENLNFFMAVREFRKKYNSSAEIRAQRLITDSKALFDRFIAEKAPEQVNLPAEATDKCRKAFLDTFNYPKGINQWIFDEAYRASFDLMVRDTFQRFRLTPQGKLLLAQLDQVESQKKSQRRANLGR